MSFLLRYSWPIIGILCCVLLSLGLLWFETTYILTGHVVPPSNQELSDWLGQFQDIEKFWVLGGSIVAAVLWMAVTVAFKSYRGDQRLGWVCLWGVAIIAAFICAFKLPEQADGAQPILPGVLTVINGVILYWVATAPFTTVTHKFAPLGSEKLRRVW
jgi:hypothetical protein